MIKTTKTGRQVHFPFTTLPPVGFVYDTEYAFQRGKLVNVWAMGFAFFALGVNYTLARADAYGPVVFFTMMVVLYLLYVGIVWICAPFSALYDKKRDGELINPNLARRD